MKPGFPWWKESLARSAAAMWSGELWNSVSLIGPHVGTYMSDYAGMFVSKLVKAAVRHEITRIHESISALLRLFYTVSTCRRSLEHTCLTPDPNKTIISLFKKAHMSLNRWGIVEPEWRHAEELQSLRSSGFCFQQGHCRSLRPDIF